MRTTRVYLGLGSLIWLCGLGIAAALVGRADEDTVREYRGRQTQTAAGEQLAIGCVSCHDFGHMNKIGPRLGGVVGRRAGSVASYDYSPAMREVGIVWTEDNLVRFLVAPEKVVPGTKMGWSGMAQADAVALVAYFKELRVIASNFKRPSLARRGLVCAALLAPSVRSLASDAGRGKDAESAAYLAALSAELQLPVTRQVQRKIAAAVAVREQRAIVRAVHRRVHQVIGAALSTAAETLAACIEDDMTAQRVKHVGGLCLSHTELALLLTSRSVAA